MTAFTSDPANVSIHDSGWCRLPSGVAITKLPLWDLEQQVFARLGAGPATELLTARLMRLPTVDEYRELHAVALHIDPVTLPTLEMLEDVGILASDTEAIDMFRNRHMMSLPWCQIHDREVLARLKAAGWTDEPVANAGKHFASHDGGPVLTGWWDEDGNPLQVASVFHRSEPEYVDYGTTCHAARECPDSNAPPSSKPSGVRAHPRVTKRGNRGPAVEAWQGFLLDFYEARGVEALPGYGDDGQHGGETEEWTERWRVDTSDTEPPPDTLSSPGSEESSDIGVPIFEFIPARNFTAADRDHSTIDWLVCHSTENPIRAGVARSVAMWFGGPSAPRASAHYVVGPDETIQCVQLEDVSWAAPSANRRGVNIEMVGQALTTDWLSDGDGERDGLAVMRQTANLVAWLCQHLDIPAERVDAAGLQEGLRGITTHATVSVAFKRSTHVDPGGYDDGRWPWPEFLRMVRAAM